MEFFFVDAAGQTLFTRSDAETARWSVHELTLNAAFPRTDKIIERGQRIAFRDPVTDKFQMFEIRQVTSTEPDHGQQITAENIAVSELQDEHIDKTEISGKTAGQALTTALTGTLWTVGNDTATGTQNADFARGSVWQAVNIIKQNWNVYITPRIVMSATGQILYRYLDIEPATGNWNGMRLSIRKNLLDPSVTYNDEEVLTALYGYGGTDGDAEVTFADVVWTATSEHPAKPANQAYLEDPAATALYGRNGRARFGYYQNAAVTDPAVLLDLTWQALKNTNAPKISITGTAVDLYRLGYKDQPLRLHDLVLVEIEETGESYYKQIIMLECDLLDPSNNAVTIGDYIPNIVYINREENKSGGGGGGGGRGQTPEQAEQSKTFAEFARTNDMIGMVVGTRNGGYYVKAAEIVLSINQDGGTNIKLDADTIDINGIVQELIARYITVNGLNVTNNAVIGGHLAGSVWASDLKVSATDATWQTKTIAGETIHYLGY